MRETCSATVAAIAVFPSATGLASFVSFRAVGPASYSASVGGAPVFVPGSDVASVHATPAVSQVWVFATTHAFSAVAPALSFASVDVILAYVPAAGSETSAESVANAVFLTHKEPP